MIDSTASAKAILTSGPKVLFPLAATILLALTFWTVPAPAQPADREVACNDVLDVDGGHYILKEDLECDWDFDFSKFAAVQITGENIHLNLNGHTISPSGTFVGGFLLWGIEVLAADVHITGGTVSGVQCEVLGFDYCAGIRLSAPGAMVTGVSAYDNLFGILADIDTRGSRISGNDLRRNLRAGIVIVDESSGTRVSGNNVSNTGGHRLGDGTPEGGWGILLSSESVLLNGNTANDNDNTGIVLYLNAENNTLRGNRALGNAASGIAVGGATEAERSAGNLIQGNTALDNGAFDLFEGNFSGGSVDCLNQWKSNNNDTGSPDDKCID